MNDQSNALTADMLRNRFLEKHGAYYGDEADDLLRKAIQHSNISSTHDETVILGDYVWFLEGFIHYRCDVRGE